MENTIFLLYKYHLEKIFITQELPSQTTDKTWIYAKRLKGKYPKTTPDGGKWVIPITKKSIDQTWEIIKKATEEGKLGNLSKVSTFKNTNKSTKVIIVYTYNHKDLKDLTKIRNNLKNLGITKKIGYKTNKATELKIYKTTKTQKEFIYHV